MNRVVVFLAAYFSVFTEGCTNVIDAGTVISSPQVADASSDSVYRPDGPLTPDQLCARTGGRIETRSCCSTTTDFSFFCSNGACTCNLGAPNVGTRTARLCICPDNECFYPDIVVMSPARPRGCAPPP